MTSPADSPPLAPRLLVALTRACTAFPRLTVLAAALLTALAGLRAGRLEILTGKLSLVPADDPVVRRYLAANEAFGTLNRLIVVLEGPRATEAARDLAARARGHPEQVAEAQTRIELDDYVSQYLHGASPEAVRGIRRGLEDARLDLAALGEDPAIATLLERAARPGRPQDLPGDERLADLRDLIRFLLGRGPLPDWMRAAGSPPRSAPGFVTDEGDYASRDRRLALVMIRPVSLADTREQVAAFVGVVEAAAAAARDAYGVAVTIGGEPALKMDETRAAQRSLALSGAASLLGVGLLFLVSFRRRTLPYLGVACLLASIVWTFAWAQVSVGHLTIVSSSFLAILIGLGVDFTIHVVCQYEALRPGHDSPRAAVIAAAEESAPGVFTGALTTSAGFFSMLLVGFPAFRGLGVVAGGGILLAVLETYSLLPAVMVLAEGRRGAAGTPAPPPPGEVACFALARRLLATPALGVLAMLALVALATGPAWRLDFDTNLLALNDPESASMRLQDSFLRDFGFSPVVNAVVLPDYPAAVRASRDLTRAAPVGFVDSLSGRIPLAPAENRDEIRRVRDLLAGIPPPRPQGPPDAARRAAAARRLATQVGRLRALLLAQGRGPAAYLAEELRRELAALAAADPAQVAPREAEVFRRLRRDLARLERAARAEPATFADLAAAERGRYVSDAGAHAAYIAPALDVRRPEEAQRFLTVVREIAARHGGEVSGLVPIQRRMVKLLRAGYRDTCLYAFLTVAFLLVLDLRRPREVALVLAVSGAGIWVLRAGMYLGGIPLNAANFIAVPLLLGVGVDNAVHLIHPWRRGVPLPEVLGRCGRPILLNSVTSMIGFGGLLLADHRGLYTLGWALSVGVFWCTAATFLLIPGALVGLGRAREAWARDAETLMSDRFA